MELPLQLLGLGFLTGYRRLRRQLTLGGKANVIVMLRAEAVWSAAGRPGMKIRCASGVVWLTQTGGGQDVVLGAGAAFTSECDGKLVITALKPAVIQVRYEKAPS